MLKQNWALIAFVYLAFAEGLSWAPVPDLALCLVQAEHSEQAANDDDKKYCAPFHAVAALAFEKADRWLETHDKSVLSGFTIVLAISTIGLWLATSKLWAAGERQFGLLAETASIQSRDMQDSIAAAKQSAEAAMLSARAAIAIQLPVIRIRPENLTWGDTRTPHTFRTYTTVDNLTFSNLGETKAFPVEIRYGYFIGDGLPVVPTYQFSETFPPNLIFEPDRKATPRKRISGDFTIDPADRPRISAGETNLWFYCDFTFDDFMQSRHNVAFCWEWRAVGGGMEWRPEGSTAYNRKT